MRRQTLKRNASILDSLFVLFFGMAMIRMQQPEGQLTDADLHLHAAISSAKENLRPIGIAVRELTIGAEELASL